MDDHFKRTRFRLTALLHSLIERQPVPARIKRFVKSAVDRDPLIDFNCRIRII